MNPEVGSVLKMDPEEVGSVLKDLEEVGSVEVRLFFGFGNPSPLPSESELTPPAGGVNIDSIILWIAFEKSNVLYLYL